MTERISFQRLNNLIPGYCPEGYCNQGSKTVYSLPPNVLQIDLDRQVCIEGRANMLCGRCQGNHSVDYHGRILRCIKNENYIYGPALYIILELLPITVLFVIIILFDVPFTSGAAFVLFCQVIETLQVQANRFIWIPALVYLLNSVSIQFVYKVFYLQFLQQMMYESYNSSRFACGRELLH